MTTETQVRRRALAVAILFAAGLVMSACGESLTQPDPDPDPVVDPPVDTVTALPATDFSRADVTTSGDVVNTEDGFTVDGSLTLGTSDTTAVTFENADVRVRFDENDRMTSISGTVEIPSPHERIEFEDPIRAEIGLFSGAFLNTERDLGILLKDDTDYFVFDFSVALQMNIATGESGENATKPISVKAPVGGRLLMVVDYKDPMYFVYGEQDLLGAAGIGWSANSRIPFVPKHSIAGLGTFDGANIRTGTFPIFKVFSITGTTVDNEYTEVHLAEEDPFDSDLRRGFQQGFNGDFELDLGIKDVFGLSIPVADGSGGIFAEASIQDVFRGHAYAVGRTTRDDSWYPSFMPVKPASELDVDAFVTHEGAFEVGLSGQFGWELPDGLYAMGGGLSVSDEALTLTGDITGADVTYAVTGIVTDEATTVSVDPPQELLDAIASDVNDEVLPRIEEAQARWEDLTEATADYEIELSLRGLRTQLPGIVDVAKKALADGIASELRKHEGKVYYSSLRSHLRAADNAYYTALDNLKAQAQQATDNQQTRDAIESALRALAAKKIFSTTYRYRDPVFGQVLYTVNVSRRIMSDSQANALINAANNVWRIEETSNIRISMQQVYDQVDDKALFDGIRDDIQDGLVVIRELGELGFVYPHAEGQGGYNVFAIIDGDRYEAGTLSDMSVDAYAALLLDVMIDALTAN